MAQRSLVFVGTYSEPIRFGTGQILQGQGKGIHAFWYDAAAATFEPGPVAEGVRNPSFIAFAPDGRHLYCVNEFKEYEGKASGAVSAYAIDRSSGRLTHLSTVASHGTDPCHLVVDATGRWVLVANFASGSVAVFPILANGAIGEASQVIQHEGSSIDPRRQAGPHAHAVTIDAGNRFVFVPDLGIDAVVTYAFDAASGRLTLNPHQARVPTKPGAGPRTMVMHPNGRFAYLINELNSTVTAFAYDAGQGVLTELHTLPTLPRGFDGHSTCAELQIAPSGRFLYGSNRGHDSVAVYAIDAASGRLAPRGHVPTGGRIPRHFCVSPDGHVLAAANQDTNDIHLFTVDMASGLPQPTGQVVAVGTPVCVRFL